MKKSKIKMVRCVEWRDEVVAGNVTRTGKLFVSRNARNFVLGAHHCGGGAVSFVSERRSWRELVLRNCLLRPTSGRSLAGIGELRKSLEDYVALGRAGRPESGCTSRLLTGRLRS